MGRWEDGKRGRGEEGKMGRCECAREEEGSVRTLTMLMNCEGLLVCSTRCTNNLTRGERHAERLA